MSTLKQIQANRENARRGRVCCCALKELYAESNAAVDSASDSATNNFNSRNSFEEIFTPEELRELAEENRQYAERRTRYLEALQK